MPDGADDDIDELEQPDPRTRIARPPAPSAIPPVTLRGVGSPSPSPELGSTGDLESLGLASHLAPRSAGPLPAPDLGSTENLEERGLASHGARPMPETGTAGIASPTGAHPRTIVDLWHSAGNIESKPLRVLGRIGVGALGALDVAGGGTMEKNAQTQKEQDLKDQGTVAQTGEATARTDQATAAAEKDRAEAAAKANPKPEKPENAQQIYADAVQDAINRGVDPNSDPKVKQIADTITGLQKQPAQQRPDTPEQQFIDAEMKKGKTLEQAVADYAKASQKPTPEPGSFMPLYDEKGHVTGAWDPKSGRVVKTPEGSLPGTTGQGLAATRPTMQMRNVAAQASLVHEQMPGVISEIQAMKADLGPVEGRWNEFMQGKVGMDNPKFAGLRTDLLMMSSAVALMHARGRLPENLREEFDNAINAPKQSAENLVSVLQHIDVWTKANMSAMGQGEGMQGGGTGGGSPTPQTHTFSLGAWQKANPHGDANAAKAAAQKAGYEVAP